MVAITTKWIVTNELPLELFKFQGILNLNFLLLL